MISFIISSDGTNVQRLKGENRTPGSAAPTSPIFPSRGLHKTTGAPKPPLTLKINKKIEQRRFTKRRYRLDRRNQQRRVRKTKVLLDTRSNHDRRTIVQRIDNRMGRFKLRPDGIDVIV